MNSRPLSSKNGEINDDSKYVSISFIQYIYVYLLQTKVMDFLSDFNSECSANMSEKSFYDNLDTPRQEVPMGGNSPTESSQLKSNKRKIQKLCVVCGDKALGFNFDAVTCESCKAFFRRNALKDDVSRSFFKKGTDLIT